MHSYNEIPKPRLDPKTCKLNRLGLICTIQSEVKNEIILSYRIVYEIILSHGIVYEMSKVRN